MSPTPVREHSAKARDLEVADAEPEEDLALEPEVHLIPLAPGQPFDMRVAPVSAATRAVSRLRKIAEEDNTVTLDEETIVRIAQTVLDPTALVGSRIELIRVETGWIARLSCGRMWVPLLNVALANDRLLAETHYEADPATRPETGDLAAVALPTSHPSDAVLCYSGDLATLAQAADRSYDAVSAQNPQEVGARIIEQPVTLVVTSVAGTHFDLCTVDGNCRVTSAMEQIMVEHDQLPPRLRSQVTSSRMPLRPSLLMSMTFQERRDLTRKIAKSATERLARPAEVGISRSAQLDRKARNVAAKTLNALHAPAELIVGYIDDDPERFGNRRFASAVRSMLIAMNVAPTQFSSGAKDAVRAEEIVVALHDAELIDDDTANMLLGRERVAESMENLGMANYPDLRFAAIAWELTHPDRRQRRIVREKLGIPAYAPKPLNGPLVELALRSFGATLSPPVLRQVRTAFESVALWPGLLQPWDLYLWVHDASAVDELELLALAELEADGAAELGNNQNFLALLGMVALVVSGHLLAPGGSAEALVGTPVRRTGVGDIVSRMVGTDWGIATLADAVRQFRSGSNVRMWSDEEGELVDPGWSPAEYSAHLRLRVQPNEGTGEPVITPAERERRSFELFAEAVEKASSRFEDLRTLRSENGTSVLLGWADVEATSEHLERLTRALARMSEAPEDEA